LLQTQKANLTQSHGTRRGVYTAAVAGAPVSCSNHVNVMIYVAFLRFRLSVSSTCSRNDDLQVAAYQISASFHGSSVDQQGWQLVGRLAGCS